MPRSIIGIGDEKYALILLDVGTGKCFSGTMETQSIMAIKNTLQRMLTSIANNPAFRGTGSPFRQGTTVRCGNEFNRPALVAFFGQQGFTPQFTTPTEGHPNRVERLIRSLREEMLSILLPTTIPLQYWPYALAHAVLVQGISPCSGIPPDVKFYGTSNNFPINQLRTFGSPCLVHL